MLFCPIPGFSNDQQNCSLKMYFVTITRLRPPSVQCAALIKHMIRSGPAVKELEDTLCELLQEHLKQRRHKLFFSHHQKTIKLAADQLE